MKIKLSTLFLILLVLVAIGINIPKGYPIKFTVGNFTVDRTTRPLVIDFTLFGKQYYKEFETKLGLDLRGGSHMLFDADVSDIPDEDKETALESARDIIERRVNFFGVSEPQVQTIQSGDTYRISVDLPGIENVDDAVALIGTTAKLEFREQVEDPTKDTKGTQDAQDTTTNGPQDAEANPTSDGTDEATDAATLETQQQTAIIEYINSFVPTGLNGSHVKKATVQFGGGQGTNVGPTVLLSFNEEGAKLFEEITARNIQKPLGIFLDDYPITQPPIVQQKIIGGEAVISGQFTVDDAKQLSIAINSGALPVPIKLIEQRNIGPTLGQESVERSLIAGGVGLLSVILFMILYYRKMGIIAAIGLMIYGLLSYALFRAIPVVLTLPGVAGFILSVGMAVDANILIFERIKEETRKGKPFHIALDLGFGKAMDAIKDANIATLLVAFILFNPLNWDFFPQFGLIKGFALTLSIGVLTSLFTGIVITRRLMHAFYGTSESVTNRTMKKK